jgi:hypothetical protein
MVDGELMECSCVGSLFQVESIPLLSEAVAHGDIFEADQNGEELVIRRVVQHANRRRYRFWLPESAIGSPQLETLILTIELSDGYWEQVFGGLLLITMPADSPYDPTSAVMAMRVACQHLKHRESAGNKSEHRASRRESTLRIDPKKLRNRLD